MSSNLEKMIARIEHEDGPFYSYAMVARRVGRSPFTIRRWVTDGIIDHPSHKMPLGNKDGWDQFCWLFTQHEMEEIEAVALAHRRGRPRKIERRDTTRRTYNEPA